MRSVSASFPTVRQELINLAGRRRRQPGEHVLHVVKRVDSMQAARLNDRHPHRCSAAALDGAGEKPVVLSEHCWPQPILGSVVVAGNEAGLGVVTKRIPLVVQIRNGFAEGTLRKNMRPLLVDPSAQCGKSRLGSAGAQCLSIYFVELGSKALNVEQTFHDRQCVVDLFRIFFSRIFKIAECLGRASSARGTIFDNTVVDGRAVSEQYALEAGQHSFRMASVVLFSKVEEYVSLIPVKPGVSLMNFAESFFDDRHFGSIGLDEPRLERQLMHALDNEAENVGAFPEPARHGCARDRHSHGAENSLLAVERQVPIELTDAGVCNETGRRESFVDRLIGFVCRDYISSAVCARVFELDMFEQLEDGSQNVELIRCRFGAVRLPLFATVRASKQRRVCNFVLDGALDEPLRNVSATTAMEVFVRHQLQVDTFFLQLGLVAVVHSLAGAGQRLAGYLCRTLSEDHAVAAAKLLFEFGDALFQLVNRFGDFAKFLDLSSEVFDHFVALGQIVWQVIGVVFVGHDRFRSIRQYSTVCHRPRWHTSTLIPAAELRRGKRPGRSVMFPGLRKSPGRSVKRGGQAEGRDICARDNRGGAPYVVRQLQRDSQRVIFGRALYVVVALDPVVGRKLAGRAGSDP